jgi:hypothetical protein
LIAQGVFKKQPIIETFTTETINDFYYDVLHLAGRMVEFARPDAAEYVPPLPSQEISLLQAVLSKIRVLVPESSFHRIHDSTPASTISGVTSISGWFAALSMQTPYQAFVVLSR